VVGWFYNITANWSTWERGQTGFCGSTCSISVLFATLRLTVPSMEKFETTSKVIFPPTVQVLAATKLLDETIGRILKVAGGAEGQEQRRGAVCLCAGP
jgi:hypothetical protein